MILEYSFRKCPEVFWLKLQVNLLIWISWTFGQAGYLPYTSSRVLCIFSFSHYMGKWHSSINFASARKFFGQSLRLICWYESRRQRCTTCMIPIQAKKWFWVLVDCGLANFNACLAHDGDNRCPRVSEGSCQSQTPCRTATQCGGFYKRWAPRKQGCGGGRHITQG